MHRRRVLLLVCMPVGFAAGCQGSPKHQAPSSPPLWGLAAAVAEHTKKLISPNVRSLLVVADEKGPYDYVSPKLVGRLGKGRAIVASGAFDRTLYELAMRETLDRIKSVDSISFWMPDQRPEFWREPPVKAVTVKVCSDESGTQPFFGISFNAPMSESDWKLVKRMVHGAKTAPGSPDLVVPVSDGKGGAQLRRLY